ncbi:hypothetical protein ACWEOA_16160 [Streptomyces sp. NPDC004457]
MAQQTFAAGQALVPDALVAGPGAAARALVGRTSFLLVVAAPAGAVTSAGGPTAGVRAVGGSAEAGGR